MFQIRSKSTKDQIKVTIKGDASVQNAEKIFLKLKSLLEEKKPIEIDTSEITFVDLSFLQIIGSAYKSLHAGGLSLSFKDNTVSESVKSVIRQTGYFHAKVTTLVPGEPSPFYVLTEQHEAI